jgi:hypothetical protein
MKTYVLICRGRSLEDSRLLSISTDDRIVKTVANLMAGVGSELSNGSGRDSKDVNTCRSGKKGMVVNEP